jgi:hypothetical protein
MRSHPSTATVGRTVVLGTWLVVLAVAGRPAWRAVLLGVALVLVWASPYLLATNRLPSTRSRSRLEEEGIGPGS